MVKQQLSVCITIIMANMPDKNNTGKEDFIVAYSFRENSQFLLGSTYSERKLWQNVCEGGNCSPYTVRKQKVKKRL